jgi:endonuclease I
MLVPVIASLADIPNIRKDYSCLGRATCPTSGWDLFVLLGYGVISGYTSVRLLRSFGSLLIGNVAKRFQGQQQLLEESTRQTAALKDQLNTLSRSLTALAPPAALGLRAGAFEAPAPQVANYYDAAADEISRRSYYLGIDFKNKATLLSRLSALLTSTHVSPLRYQPSIHLYPAVDLHPDGLLRSIYSGKTFEISTLLAMDAQVDQARAAATAGFSALRLSDAELDSRLEMLDKKLPYNCEHVMPQSWFGKKEPMRGDLHHLFTCEMTCNGFRDDNKYVDFENYGRAFADGERDDCGKREGEYFEPERNKGVVARAVLYFLVRYPSAVVAGRGYSAKDIPMLLQWHNQEAVTLYEKHRNQEIQKKQGNRNPFIDFPQLFEEKDFNALLTQAGSSTDDRPTPHSGDDAEAAGLAEAAFEGCARNPNPKPWKAADSRIAASLKKLRDQVNAAAPNRNKESDGWFGDLAHQATNSDHNPWVWDEASRKGVVTALDITHDPAGKCDCRMLAKTLESSKDPRIKYVIWNRKIMNSSPIGGSDAWVWRDYTGQNPHVKHIHISVQCSRDSYDATHEWTVQLSAGV